MFLVDRFSQAYVDGVDSFIEFAKAQSGEAVEIKCPCRNCRNYYKNEYDTVKAPLLVRGMMVSYTTWLLHGEIPQIDEQGDSEDENGDDGDDDYEQLMEDHYKGTYMDGDTIERERNFEQLLEAAQRSLYPGCSDTLLSFIIEILQVKVEHGWSNTSFNRLLKLATIKMIRVGPVVTDSQLS
ncbi:hypothetical protein Vadar_029362 [Vaccinium darrowii]|uniref:Uncharacterized protein n=1 Tax=Vaccinium darrowii TaxID=229202 RepID=A0ACB7XD09_9ERIC|nr:hypothetical protein Vadar_029362 [Vaccinium darrowii]